MDKAKLNDLVTKARAGDRAAMDELVRVSQKDLHYYALKIVKKEDLAEDALQDSWVEIITTIGNLRESTAFVTWSRRIVYHHCLKRVGKTRVTSLDAPVGEEDGETIADRIPDETPGTMPQEIVENRELRETLMGMLDQLSESQRSAMMLYYYQRMAVKEIAAIQDENENTVKSQLYQGRKAMKKQVESYEKKTGTKLHSVAILPLLYTLFHWGRAQSDAAATAFMPRLQAALEPVLAANFGVAGTAAAATAGAASAGAATAGAATATTGAAVTAGTAFFSSVAVKIAAGIVAAALVIGGIVVGTQNKPNENPTPSNGPSQPASPSVPNVPTPPQPNFPSDPGHTHSFDTLAFDDDAHFHICQCGVAADDREAHTFVDGECSVCHMIQPLPGGNELLTFDCTTLTGHWINLEKDYKETSLADFYISGDGSILVDGVTYYPIGSDVFEADEYSDWSACIYFRDTPYDPAVGVTQEEMYQSLVSISLRKMGEHYRLELFVAEAETYRLKFNGKFYRESDFFGYEQVALTPENFYNYVTVIIEPIEFYYVNLSLSASQDIVFTLREDLGYPSWFQISGTYQYKYAKVYYNIETHTYEVDPFNVVLDGELNCAFYGHHNKKEVMHTSAEGFFPENHVVEWYGNVTEGITLDSVIGYVFVPKQ